MHVELKILMCATGEKETAYENKQFCALADRTMEGYL